jgi:hypothetical protein
MDLSTLDWIMIGLMFFSAIGLVIVFWWATER